VLHIWPCVAYLALCCIFGLVLHVPRESGALCCIPECSLRCFAAVKACVEHTHVHSSTQSCALLVLCGCCTNMLCVLPGTWSIWLGAATWVRVMPVSISSTTHDRAC